MKIVIIRALTHLIIEFPSSQYVRPARMAESRCSVETLAEQPEHLSFEDDVLDLAPREELSQRLETFALVGKFLSQKMMNLLLEA